VFLNVDAFLKNFYSEDIVDGRNTDDGTLDTVIGYVHLDLDSMRGYVHGRFRCHDEYCTLS
jgi:hypothetical protein